MFKKRILLTEQFPALKEIGIMEFRFEIFKDYRTDLRKHHHGPYCEIGYIQTGIFSELFFDPEETAVEDATVFELHGEDLIRIPPNRVHSTAPYFPLNALSYWLILDPECPNLLKFPPESADLLRQVLRKTSHNIFHIPQSISARLLEAFHLLTNPTESHLFRACNLLALFLLESAELEQRYASHSSAYSALSPAAVDAVLFISNNLLSASLNLDSLAKHLGYSRTYTSTFMKKELGMNLQDYIIHSKIKLACQLLQNHTVTETAMLLNFSSSQYFSNVFKKQMHMTPSEYQSNSVKENG